MAHTFDELCTFPLQEPMDVVELFGLSGIQHTPISIKNARVSQVRELSKSWDSYFQGPGIAFREAGLAPDLCQADANTGNDCLFL